jgi:hypothetical protein
VPPCGFAPFAPKHPRSLRVRSKSERQRSLDLPRIFDNITQPLLPALIDTLKVSHRADFCVGYFNLRGWKNVSPIVAPWSGADDECARVLVGMQKLPDDVLRDSAFDAGSDDMMDNQRAVRLKAQLAKEFRSQLTIGAPTNADETALRELAEHLRSKRVRVRLFLRHLLHAKLYLAFRDDKVNPRTGFVGSSNLTVSGLSKQGELNVDVLDHDATSKLERWFNDRWADRWCLDISDELIAVIEQSWARPVPPTPYQIYVKMAYHLSREARMGLSSFSIPRDMRTKVLAFQSAAIRIAANHLNRRGGVLLGDVVGLGKTLMATALARIFEDDYGFDALIVCPKRLVKMWQKYADDYRLRARVLPLSRAIAVLPTLRRYRLMIVDESHNLRNREGKIYRAIQDFIRKNECRCILLSATPYNKTYADLSSQLRLFLDETKDIGIRPERLISEIGEIEFRRRHQASPRSLAAFEHSPFADDWRDLMRLYLVRRTRTFIKENYAEIDPADGRAYLAFDDGTRAYFPDRIPLTAKFSLDDERPRDQYAHLFDTTVVNAIDALALPRYGLGNYAKTDLDGGLTAQELKVVADLSRAGKRLMGFCRTNLFKRLESSGESFILSMQRHVLRNYVYLHALEHGLPVPIGTQDAAFLEPQNDDGDENDGAEPESYLSTSGDFEQRAARAYAALSQVACKRYRWLPAATFTDALATDLRRDAESLRAILARVGRWRPEDDAKLNRLHELITKTHPDRKVLVFTQFADTADYVAGQLKLRGVTRLEAATGDSADPTELAIRFSPVSNETPEIRGTERELRVLVATDVLSEGQNLQDCSIVVNFDLPWAIIGLIQRAGRLDRIGQQSAQILCYSFLPATGVERIIGLRARVRRRLRENAEVVGTDEAFFEDEDAAAVIDIYNEKVNALDGEDAADVDLSSYAYQIWKNATTADPSLESAIHALPDVVYATKPIDSRLDGPDGVLVYAETAGGEDALARVDRSGTVISESQYEILKAAECLPETPGLPRTDEHHGLVARVAAALVRDNPVVGGQLGNPRGARFQVYERLKALLESGRLVSDPALLKRALDEVYGYPLRPGAVDTLNRQLRSGASDLDLAEVVIELYQDDALAIVDAPDERRRQQPQIICSLGLSGAGGC